MPQGAPLSACTAPGPCCASSYSLTSSSQLYPELVLRCSSTFCSSCCEHQDHSVTPFSPAASLFLEASPAFGFLFLSLPVLGELNRGFSSLKAVGAALLMRQCRTWVCAKSGWCGHHRSGPGPVQDSRRKACLELCPRMHPSPRGSARSIQGLRHR